MKTDRIGRKGRKFGSQVRIRFLTATVTGFLKIVSVRPRRGESGPHSYSRWRWHHSARGVFVQSRSRASRAEFLHGYPRVLTTIS